MFTGLIEEVCSVTSVRKAGQTMALTIDLAKIAAEVRIGDSIAVNGVCLTVTKLNSCLADFDVSGETLARSNLGRLSTGSMVNIERAISAGDRFGGHFVQGHVDGQAEIKKIENSAGFYAITFSAKSDILQIMIQKGSVAVNGISLTISALDSTGFAVSIIPQTWKNTNFSYLKAGDCVNIENDIILKAVKKQLDLMLPKKNGLTLDKLKELGF